MSTDYLLDFVWDTRTITLCIVAGVVLAAFVALCVLLILVKKRRKQNAVSQPSAAVKEETSEDKILLTKQPEEALPAAPVAEAEEGAAEVIAEAAEEEDEPDSEEELREEAQREPVRVIIRNNRFVNIRYDRSFTARLFQSSEKTKSYYTQIKNELIACGAKSRISWRHETFRIGRKLVAMMCIRGKTLYLYLALDPAAYAESKYLVNDVSGKNKYRSVPCLYRIKNDRRCRYAKELIVALGLEKKEIEAVDYGADYPYSETSVLVMRGLIKIVEVADEEEVAPEEDDDTDLSEEEAEITEDSDAKTEVAASAAAEAAEAEEDEPDTVEELLEEADREPIRIIRRDNHFISIRYDKSFTARLIQSSEKNKDYYTQIKNELIAYGAKPRISWRQESFRVGRKTVAMMRMRGKTLYLYLALNPADYVGSKYLINDVSEKNKYRDIPCLYRIKNDRRCRYAKELIAALGLERTETEAVNFGADYPYEETEPLVLRGLIKLVETTTFNAEAAPAIAAEEEIGIPAETVVEEPAEEREEPVEQPVEEIAEAPAEEPEEIREPEPEPAPEPEPEPVGIKAAEVKELMADEAAKQLVEDCAHYSDKTKPAVVNVDTLGEYFKDGERVTLEEMRSRIPYLSAKTTYVKILARGSLNKSLEVEADDFSLDAIKMIALAGGKIYRKRTR